MSLKNKAVLISIRPEWCDLIVRGKKTIEVRKTRLYRLDILMVKLA